MNECQYKSQTRNKDQDEILLQPLNYILQVPGKMIRGKLAFAFNDWLKIPFEKLAAIGDIVSLLHNASLLIDDIQDGSVLRRGIPVAHSIYGVASTINAAKYVVHMTLKKVLSLGHPQAVSVYTKQVLELHRGQGMDVYWRDSEYCPSEEEYKTMVIQKTGGLFILGIGLMQLFSDNKTDFTKLINVLGLYFQIRDDYCNLSSKEYSENKSYCEDITEGKFSFPIIHAIRSWPEDPQILNILRQRTQDVNVKRYCVQLLEKYGSLQYTYDVLVELDRQAREEIDKLGGNPKLVAILDRLYDWNKREEVQSRLGVPASFSIQAAHKMEPPKMGKMKRNKTRKIKWEGKEKSGSGKAYRTYSQI